MFCGSTLVFWKILVCWNKGEKVEPSFAAFSSQCSGSLQILAGQLCGVILLVLEAPFSVKEEASD